MKKLNKGVSALASKPEMGVVLPLIILLAVIGCVNSNFFAPANLIDILRSTSYTFIIAAPLTLLMISGGMDLSIAAATALGCVVCAWGIADFHIGIIPSVLLALAAGAVVGLIKAFLVVKLDLPAFIITLGLTKIINSFILVTTDGIAVSNLNNNAFKQLGQGKLGSVYWTIIIAAVCIFCSAAPALAGKSPPAAATGKRQSWPASMSPGFGLPWRSLYPCLQRCAAYACAAGFTAGSLPPEAARS